jgi:NADPH:quinone reductase-like Zn-dependent oxidoreductase
MLSFRNDLKTPKPRTGEVLIRVRAAAVNNTDINTRVAWYSKRSNNNKSDDASWCGQALVFPRIQGTDVCGTIVAVGAGVSPARMGERVLVEPCLIEANGQRLEQPWYLGSECDGGFAQYTRVAARHAYPIHLPPSSSMTDAELASFPCSYSTAENMLTKSQVTDKDTVLITGASGGVGSAAVQLARARGARVIAVTRSPDKCQALQALGASQTVDRNDDDLCAILGPNSVDVVLDLVGGSQQWPHLLDILRPKGRYAVAGAIAGPMVSLDLRTLYLKDLSLLGCTVLASQTVDHNDDDLCAILGPNSVDVVLDLVGGSQQWPHLLDILRPKGRYAVAGAIAGPMVSLDLRTLYLKDLSLLGCTVLEPGVFGNLVTRIETGQIQPLVAQTFPMQDIHAAQALFTKKSHIGKIVLEWQ